MQKLFDEAESMSQCHLTNQACIQNLLKINRLIFLQLSLKEYKNITQKTYAKSNWNDLNIFAKAFEIFQKDFLKFPRELNSIFKVDQFAILSFFKPIFK